MIEIQAKTLGMKVEIFDPTGNNIEHTGQPGELVCTRPHPSLPLYFWGDSSGEKLRDAYFNMYPGIVIHITPSLLPFSVRLLPRNMETRRFHGCQPDHERNYDSGPEV